MLLDRHISIADITEASKTISFNTQDLNVKEHRIQYFLLVYRLFNLGT